MEYPEPTHGAVIAKKERLNGLYDFSTGADLLCINT